MATPSDNTNLVYESQSVPRDRRKRPKKEADDEEDEEEVKSFYSQVEQVSQEVRTPSPPGHCNPQSNLGW